MKKIFLLCTIILAVGTSFAQDFNKNLASARGSYSAGNLEEARFAMQQMLNDVDLVIGREILKLLPAKMGALASNSANDNVSVTSGLTGVLIHRDYGSGEKKYNLDLMSNSPLIASVNAILSIPFIGNAGDGSQKVVRIDGYKGMLQRSVDETTKKMDFTLQIPIGSTLLTFTVPDSNEDDVMKMANTIPMSQITKLAQ